MVKHLLLIYANIFPIAFTVSQNSVSACCMSYQKGQNMPLKCQKYTLF